MSRVLLFVFTVFGLIACSTTSVGPTRAGSAPQDISPLLVDNLFFQDGGIPEISDIDIFELPPQVKAYLDREVMSLPTEERRYRAIREWIFDKTDSYEYDPDTTVAITDLEKVGKINCFSFSNLFVAAARYADIDAHVQLVYSPPNWDVSERTWVLNQHINVSGSVKGSTTLGESRSRVGLPTHTGTILKPEFLLDTFIKYVVDLNPKIVVNAYRTEVLQDHEVASRFYSNIAAQELMNEDYPTAYQYLKKALLEDKASSVAWNNLGVLYSRIDQTDLARKSYLTAIQVDPDADAARNNLASLYRMVGNTTEADALDGRIEKRRNKNPYYHYYLGEDLLRVGDYREAIRYFNEAIRRKKDEQLFYLSLAETQLALDQLKKAERSLKKAGKYATKANREQYAKLTRDLLQRKRTREL